MSRPILAPPEGATDWCRFTALADTTEVYIYDEIGFWGTTAAAFAEQVSAIRTPRIVVHLNSPGGDAWDGIAIANVLRAHQSRVEVVIDGLAASAASMIALAGDTVTMGPSSMLMIHDASAFAWGSAATMRETAEILDKLSDSYADAYAAKANGTRAEWRDVMRAETWYTAAEAVAAGLADAMDESLPAVAHTPFRTVQPKAEHQPPAASSRPVPEPDRPAELPTPADDQPVAGPAAALLALLSTI